jgi:hypothetical protein
MVAVSCVCMGSGNYKQGFGKTKTRRGTAASNATPRFLHEQNRERYDERSKLCLFYMIS